MLDYLGEAPEPAGLQPGDAPIPLLEPPQAFRVSTREMGRAVADAQLAQRLEIQGFGLKAVFADPREAHARLLKAFAEPNGGWGGVASELEQKPEAFGTLRGRRRVLLGDDRERREARAALPRVVARVRMLQSEWSQTYSDVVREEKTRRKAARVKIPGLSAAAQAFLTAYQAGSRGAGEALIGQALRSEEGRAVMEEFSQISGAAKQREGHARRGADWYAYQDMPGLDRKRGLALGETIKAIQGIDHDRMRIAYEQEQAQRLAQERAQRRGRDGPVLGL